jgi:hypothetical protein
MTLKAYCMKWHLDKSDAFRDLVVDPLKDKLDVELVDIKKWQKDPNTPQIFCQVKPPEELFKNPRAKVVWIPMWDNVLVEYHDQSWWNNLPKHIKIVCFSQAVHDRASRAGLPNLYIKYYKNPDDFKKVQWQKLRIFYWNRVGLVGPQFLNKLCSTLKVDEIIFRPELDPGISEELQYELPAVLGGASVKVIHEMDRKSHLRAIEDSNIYIAPRMTEGVGMTFIEAMSRGAVVLAYNAPTMNEYIHHTENGYLFNNLPSRRIDKRVLRVANRLVRQHTGPCYALSLDQPWSEISRLEWENLGAAALRDSQKGYAEWTKSLEAYSNFLTAW